MGRLVVIEGLDGAGKQTLADGLDAALVDRGVDVGRMAFPRYDSVHGRLLADALHGRLGDLADSVHAMAVLFALDRYAAAPQLARALARHDVVLCDRYVASNAAYGAARLHQDAAGAFVRWAHWLELERMHVRAPDLQLLLRTPVEVAAGRAGRRAAGDPTRARDAYEMDAGLQRRCATVYEQLAAAGSFAPWLVVDGDGAGPGEVAERLIGNLGR